MADDLVVFSNLAGPSPGFFVQTTLPPGATNLLEPTHLRESSANQSLSICSIYMVMSSIMSIHSGLSCSPSQHAG